MGYHKLGMQAIGIVYVSKHDGAQIYEVKLCTVSKCWFLRKMITLSLCNLMVLELASLVKDFWFRLNYFLGAPDWIIWNSVGEVIVSRTVVFVNFPLGATD
jgi:hypothetical protein